MKFKYDPPSDKEYPETVKKYGYNFKKGETVEVDSSIEKFRSHPLFKEVRAKRDKKSADQAGSPEAQGD